MVNENAQQQFKLHLPGLLTILSENLYTTRKVAIRELLQNAHDSTVRRRVEMREPDYTPRITLRIDQEIGWLTVRDNGFGLNREEIEEYLATIGRSYTREMRDDPSLSWLEDATSLIGQFGLGFLSAFLLASDVIVTSCQMQPDGKPGQTFRFTCANDGHYVVTPVDQGEIGTVVALKVKPEAAYILQEPTLVAAVRQYADFLPVSIFIEGDPAPVNSLTPPWEQADVHSATLDYIRREYKLEPLFVLFLEDANVDLGHDQMVVPLRGFLFIPPSSVASLHEYGDVRVFVRRMFITDRHKTLLPPWARFVQGVIECPDLELTASREDLHENDTLLFVQQAIEMQLLAGLNHLAKTNRTIWQQIVRGHSDVIIGWAIKDNEFFDHVRDIVTFRTSRGRLTLPEYLQSTDKTLYYVTRENGTLQEEVLAESHDIPVIDAKWFSVEPFLRKYAELNHNITVVQVDGEAEYFMRPVSSEPYKHLLAYYQARGIRVQVKAFKPSSMPGIMLYPPDVEFLQETRQALDSGEFPDPIANMVEGYISRRNVSEEDLRGTLSLNASCPLIDQLSEQSTFSNSHTATLDIVYQFARLFAGRTLNSADAVGAYQEIIDGLEALLS
ncbi:MAG: ATP-binding protein [Anaerolineae bacterium]|nr:ATP-binding protein [Anaerolineae bacterium]